MYKKYKSIEAARRPDGVLFKGSIRKRLKKVVRIDVNVLTNKNTDAELKSILIKIEILNGDVADV